jgi:hypothetical protein
MLLDDSYMIVHNKDISVEYTTKTEDRSTKTINAAWANVIFKKVLVTYVQAYIYVLTPSLKYYI